MTKYVSRTVLCLGFPLIFIVLSAALIVVDIFFNTIKLCCLFKEAWRAA